jgi:hypothetical protein
VRIDEDELIDYDFDELAHAYAAATPPSPTVSAHHTPATQTLHRTADAGPSRPGQPTQPSCSRQAKAINTLASLGHRQRRRRLLVFTQRISKAMIQIMDRLTQTSFGPARLKEHDALQPVPNAVGQMIRDLTRHELSFDHCEQADQR